MSPINKKQVLAEFENAKDRDLFCAFCYETLRETKEGMLYCPNETCLNDKEYAKDGKIIENIEATKEELKDTYNDIELGRKRED